MIFVLYNYTLYGVTSISTWYVSLQGPEHVYHRENSATDGKISLKAGRDQQDAKTASVILAFPLVVSAVSPVCKQNNARLNLGSPAGQVAPPLLQLSRIQ
jgi:hypothetical protein